MAKIKKSPKMLELLVAEREVKRQHDEQIKQMLQALIDNRVFILSF